MEHEPDTLPHWLNGSPQGAAGHASAAYDSTGSAQPAYPAGTRQPVKSAHAAEASRTSTRIATGAAPAGFLTLFTEEEIGTPSPAARRAAPVISPLVRFGSAQDRIEFVRQRIRQLGFDSFSYTATRTSSHHMTMFVLTSYESQTWLARYFRERYFEIDPRVALASPTGMPFLWNTADMRAELPRTQMRSERLGGLIDMLETAGRKSGILTRMPLPEPELSASLCFNSEIGNPRWMTESIVAETLMFAHMIHEFMWTHAKSVIGMAPAQPQRVALSELQHAVLKAVVQGQRDKEIAYFLGLSPHNVDYHLRRLRQLFNVRNRVQLINVAHAYVS
ncbi:Response regulator containing a CheY-like receiver domain and an HTH DNA-binding domain [Paraburkholderia ribeironis]|uniref:Response regulator containing a CheY-like receiver domain and an HTH DNA-binding domain n=1 Tax=Paraburkholderia ribeironis TaxID=1247936 RepID=A0A1N7SDC6_9BURK|nr:LuxR family transcriptional regulator [Paraburkholderia ribeironis]SIT45380.1 Response regulator containing a CheY-like receiver domain and an HTH DNA-binding domain [Paraburkholderia ribeironis]